MKRLNLRTLVLISCFALAGVGCRTGSPVQATGYAKPLAPMLAKLTFVVRLHGDADLSGPSATRETHQAFGDLLTLVELANGPVGHVDVTILRTATRSNRPQGHISVSNHGVGGGISLALGQREEREIRVVVSGPNGEQLWEATSPIRKQRGRDGWQSGTEMILKAVADELRRALEKG